MPHGPASSRLCIPPRLSSREALRKAWIGGIPGRQIMHIGTICIQIVPMCTRNGACTWVRAGQPSSDQSGVVKPKAVYVRGLKAKADQFLRKHVRLCLRPRGKVAPKHALSDSMNGFCGIGLTNVRTAQKGKRDPFDCKQSLVLGGITATQGQGRHIARQRAGGRVTRLRSVPTASTSSK